MHSTQYASSAKLLVSSRQKGNRLLGLIKNVGWEMVNEALPSDFHVNQEVGVLFLSMRYHMMHPRYLVARLDGMLGYKQRIVLLHNDSPAGDQEMISLSGLCITKNATLIVAFSDLECARYLETFKQFEAKPPDIIRGEPKSAVHEDVFAECLTSIRSVNQSDAAQLGTTFGTLTSLASAQTEELLLCPGLGAKKAKRIKEVFENPL